MPGKQRRLLLGGGFLIVLAVAGIAFGIGRAGVGGEGEALDADGCAVPPVRVVTSPEIADTVQAALFRVTDRDRCTRYVVAGRANGAVAREIAGGTAPDVWVPDSPIWLDELGSKALTDRWKPGPVIASTPVVLAVPASGPAPTPASWDRLFNVTGNLQVANPDNDTASRLAYLASRAGAKGDPGLHAAARLIFTSRFAASDQARILAAARSGSSGPDPFPAAEQAVAAFDATHPGRLRAVVPRAGTLTMDYPWVVSPDARGGVRDAADTALRELQGETTREDLAAAGFRAPDASGGPRIGGRAAPAYTELALLGADKRLAAISQWDLLRTDMRMLAVIDVSGSMAWPARGSPGMSRAEVTRAAILRALRILPAGSKIGAWVFSTSQAGPRTDHAQLAPIRALSSRAAGGGTWRAHLVDMTNTIPGRLEGDTGLYDTTWAAFRRMQKDYDRNYVNSVVIMTDGVNDDPLGGLTLQQLLTRIRGSWDPRRPVRIITIGMGEADSSALTRISRATGGTSYIADTPSDIQRVFVKALLARQHAPDRPT